MPAVAIDIGTYTIKVVHAKPGDKPQILRTVEVFNQTGVSVPTDAGVAAKLGQEIEAIFNDHKLPRTDVRLSLPEQVVSTKVVEMPPLSDAELASAIGWQAEQHIPIPVEELALEYQVLYRPPRGDHQQKMRVLLVGVRKGLIEQFINLFIDIGIEPTHLETQIISTVRALQFTAEDPTTMVVQIGASAMEMSVIWQGELRFVFSHLNGGQLLTKTIMQAVGLDEQQAEQYKRTFGLRGDQFEGKIRTALEPSVKIFVNEILKAQQFFLNQNPGQTIQRVLLAGGTAQLPDLVEYLAGEIGLEVLVASPFATATGEIPQTNHPAFTVPVGLVMKH
jgi:type IV pilus assembly protein PilM